jgi:hypothetical protein
MDRSPSFGRALDTASRASAVQTARWREMSDRQKADLVAALARATRQLAEAGIAARYPDASPRERFLRLAILQLGRALAVQVYPDAERLTP